MGRASNAKLERRIQEGFARALETAKAPTRGVQIIELASLIGTLAWFGVPAPFFFWVATVSGYVLLLSAVRLLWTKEFDRIFRVVLTLVVITFAAEVSRRVVLNTAPLNTYFDYVNTEYPAGTTLAGIRWRPEYTQVNITFTNPTDGNYDDFDVVVNTDQLLAAAGSTGDCFDISISDAENASVNMVTALGRTV